MLIIAFMRECSRREKQREGEGRRMVGFGAGRLGIGDWLGGMGCVWWGL